MINLLGIYIWSGFVMWATLFRVRYSSYIEYKFISYILGFVFSLLLWPVAFFLFETDEEIEDDNA